MDTIGLDLHKRETQLCVLAPDGTAKAQRILTSRERFTARTRAAGAGPHDALGADTPASRYAPSPREDPEWAIYFNAVLLATLDERDFVIRG